jgi:cephalosporin-C deacetylase-like acetyl esterase
MSKLFSVLLLIFAGWSVALAQESYPQLVRHFDYDRKSPLDIKEIGVEERDGVIVHDLTYASPKGGRVPAYLVVPAGTGPFAAILFGHWAMDGSPTRNRTEFLEEATAFAHAGAVSLLIDAPFVRPGFIPQQDPLSPQQAEVELQQILDLRRGVDLLLSRSDVDPKRVAYVGHSFDAGMGGILSGVEKRIKTFVLMAGLLSVTDTVLSDDTGMVKFRQATGEQKVREYLQTYSWLDPAYYIAHAAPASLLLQHARVDGHAGEGQARHFLALASAPKELKIYEATHALNAQARRDRYDWLRRQIGLRRLKPEILARVSDIK